jgi:hypothetical protein
MRGLLAAAEGAPRSRPRPLRPPGRPADRLPSPRSAPARGPAGRPAAAAVVVPRALRIAGAGSALANLHAQDPPLIRWGVEARGTHMGGRRGGCEGEWEGERMQHGSPVGRVGAVTPSYEEEVTGVQTCPTQGLNAPLAQKPVRARLMGCSALSGPSRARARRRAVPQQSRRDGSGVASDPRNKHARTPRWVCWSCVRTNAGQRAAPAGSGWASKEVGEARVDPQRGLCRTVKQRAFGRLGGAGGAPYHSRRGQLQCSGGLAAK